MIEVEVKFETKLFTEGGKLTPQARLAISNALGRIAKDFKNLTRRRIVESVPLGRLYRRKSGAGFRRFHRASAVGQRPAIDTGTLLNAIDDARINEFTTEVFIAPKPNSRNGTKASVYAEYLQGKMKRRIMDKADAEQAAVAAVKEMEQSIGRLLNAG